MKNITTIENDCFYMWIDKPADPTHKQKMREILIGDSIGGYIKSTGIAKFKKFFEKDLKKERSVAYKYEKRFKKEKDTKWFIISQIELTKGKVQGCETFDEITAIDHTDFIKPNGRKPLRKKHYYYIVTF